MLPGLADRVVEAALAGPEVLEPSVGDEARDDETSSVEAEEVVTWSEVDEDAKVEDTGVVLVVETTVVEAAGLLAAA